MPPQPSMTFGPLAKFQTQTAWRRLRFLSTGRR
jgi:hypothetical protein